MIARKILVKVVKDIKKALINDRLSRNLLILLVKNIATKIIDIKDGKITVFDGSYEAYEEWLENKTKSNKDDQLLLIETKISDVLGRLSMEPSQELEDEFQRLLKEKKELTKKL